MQEAEAPSQVRLLIDRAIRIAKAENGVSVLILPGDLQDEPYEDPPRQHGSVFSGVGYASPRWCPTRPTCAALPRC